MKQKPSDLVLFVDDDLLVVNKPAGLPVLPDGYDPQAPYVGSFFSPGFGSLWVVHRLDRETSGVLVLARTPEAHRMLNTQFETRQAKKIYHALVRGNPAWEECIVRLPLRADGDRHHRSIVDHRQGKPSVTKLKVLERFDLIALVEARPETGRTHQIRVHLASRGNPVVGDELYGDGKSLFLSEIKPGYKKERGVEQPLLDRLGLHARSLELIHPGTHEVFLVEAPYPKDLNAALKQLRKAK